MQKMPHSMRSCTMQTCGFQLNPLDVNCTTLAGEACKTCVEDLVPVCVQPAQACDDCLYATAYMADQRYKAGYCPAETLKQGTYFPELVRPYSK